MQLRKSSNQTSELASMGLKHRKARQFSKSGLFKGLHSFSELEDRVSALPKENRGDAFEVFAEAYISTQKSLQADEVWPEGTIPQSILRKFNLPPKDLGVGLIAFAAHGNRVRQPAIIEPSTRQKTVVREVEHAAQFAVEAFTPAPDSAADLIEVYGAYQEWCGQKGVAALPAAQIGGALANLFDGTGVTVAEHQGHRVALGVAVKTKPSRKALGRLATVGAR